MKQLFWEIVTKKKQASACEKMNSNASILNGLEFHFSLLWMK